MDHLVTTPAEICQLVNLQNVTCADAIAEIFNAPAVRDLLIDIVLSRADRIRLHITLKDKIKNPAPDSLTSRALVSSHELHRGYKSLWMMSGVVQPAADGLIVSGDARQTLKDSTKIDPTEEIGRASYAWLEFNYLLLHKPDSIRTWRRAADADQRAVLHIGKSAPKKIYVRMRKLPELTDTEKWAELRPASSGSPSGVFIRHCDAWGVRGHYRHYKSGRVSYVTPYVKGANRESYRGREFELLSEVKEK